MPETPAATPLPFAIGDDTPEPGAMAKEVLCPICGATYNLADEQLGKKVRCKKCEHAFTAGGEKKRRDNDYDDEDDDGGIQDAPRGKTKSKSKARKDRGRDRDDDEDRRPKKTKSVEEQAKPRGERDPGLPVSSFVIMGVVLGILFLCCGGAGLIYWMWPQSKPANQPNQQPNNPPNRPGRRADANPPADVPPPGFPPPPPNLPQLPPDFPQPPGWPPANAPAVSSLKEALEFLRGGDPGRQQAGADWLARAPRDEAQADAVSKALNPLITAAQSEVFAREEWRAAFRAVKVWGTKESVPALVDFIKAKRANDPHWIHTADLIKDAMAALSRIGDERGVEGLLAFSDTVHGIHLGDFPERALQDMGAKAEKGLVKYYDDPADGKRNMVRRLLERSGAKPDVILPQIIADLRDGSEVRRRQAAAEGLEKVPLIESRRGEVSKALNFALEDPDGNVNTAGVKAAKTWATKENVPALIRHVTEGGPFNTPLRQGAMEALVALKEPDGVWPIARWLGDAFNNDSARKMIDKLGPVAEKVGLEHLKDADGASRLRAWAVLSLVGTQANVATMEAAAAKETDANSRARAAEAIRLAKLRR
jgi:predicted Zn finger-like uncharacterized protein